MIEEILKVGTSTMLHIVSSFQPSLLIFPPLRLSFRRNVKSRGSVCLDILGLYPVVIVTWILRQQSFVTVLLIMLM